MKNTINKLIFYLWGLIFLSFGLVYLNFYFQKDILFDQINIISLVLFSFVNIVCFIKPFPIIDNEEEKTIAMDFYINIIALLTSGYLTLLISSIAGTLYSILTKYVLKRNIGQIYKPLFSLFSIVVSISLMNLSYLLLKGNYSYDLSILDLFPLLFASMINYVSNGFTIALAINLTMGNKITNVKKIFEENFLWLYKFFLWDAIYAFLSCIAIMSILITKQSFILALVTLILFYPVGQRIISFKINVKYNKQNKDLLKLNKDLEETNYVVIKAFLSSLEAKDKTTQEHSIRVSEYACILARKFGFSEDKIKIIKIAGMLHDIGKMQISENILNKTGKLTDEEFMTIRQHPSFGLDILKKIYEGSDIDNENFQIIANITSTHHERFDGRGYPNKLKEYEIPIEGRILSLVDAFDAMTGFRTYREPFNMEEALKEITKNKGSQFCPEVVDKFLECVNNGEIKIIKEI